MQIMNDLFNIAAFILYFAAYALIPAIVFTAIVGILMSPYYLYRLIRKVI